MRTRVAVVGGGMMGFRLAQRLSASSAVTVLEAAPSLGGLTSQASFSTPRGEVRWDRFYHVVLSQDVKVQQLLAELGRSDTLTLKTVKSELLDGTGTVRPMSSVIDLITLGALPLMSRLRVGMTVAMGGLLPAGNRAEDITASDWARRWSGRVASENLWEPLLRAKLGEYSGIASSTFLRSTYRRLVLARLSGGTGDKFGWLDGGYQPLLEAMVERLRQVDVAFRTEARVTSVQPLSTGEWQVSVSGDLDPLVVDEVILTAPGPIAASLLAPLSGIDNQVTAGLAAAKYLGCVCVSLLATRRITDSYLTYVTADAPYTGVIEMGNLAEPDQFAGYSLLYLPKYVAPDDPLFDRPPEEIAEEFVSDLVSRYPGLGASEIVVQQTAKARHVMPVPVAGWEATLPHHRTGLAGLYLSSSVQMPHGTLNVESTINLADECVGQILADRRRGQTMPSPEGVGEPLPPVTTTARLTQPDLNSTVTSPVLKEPGVKPTASVSLDADNLWSYLKTRGDTAWESRPSYLPALQDQLLGLWDDFDIKATIFVVGHDAAKPDGAALIAAAHAQGHEIANHSFEHEPWLHLYPVDRLEEELAKTEDAIVAAGAPRPRGFRGPGYSLSPDLVRLLQQRQYTYDCSTLPTWIGPLARAYYFRQAKLSSDEQEERSLLFGRASEGLRRNGPYRWAGGIHPETGETLDELLEIPVTTMPFARVPIHLSYLITAHQVNPRLARVYERMALRLCRLTGTGPSILMHPLDLLGTKDAPGLEFFPAAAYSADKKREITRRFLGTLQEKFDVVGTGNHAESLRGSALPAMDPASLAVPASE